tara:strand:- start:471 stop:869 length:399 start_codon:yes stop_codon:yes gene_type:complete
VVALKKIWSFIKSYWYIPILIIVAIVLRKKSDNVKEILSVANDSHKKQMDAINNAEIEKQKSRQVIEDEYENAVKKIEESYATKNLSLDKRDKKLVKTLIKEWEDEPDQMAERISNKFGIHYVPKANTIDPN